MWHYEGGCAKQTIPLSVLARNQKKGLDSRSRTGPEVGKGTPVRSWKKQPRESSWRRARQKGKLAVDTRQQKRPVGMRIGSRSSEGRPVKKSQHSSWFVEFSLEIHPSVSLQGKQCHKLTFLHLSCPKPYCSLFFFSHYLDCIPCAMKKCQMPLSETTRWFTGQGDWNGFEKVDLTCGGAGIVTFL